MNTEPMHIRGLSMQRWRELGPIDLNYFVEYTTAFEIDYNLDFIIKDFANGVFKGQLDKDNVEQGIARL